MKLEGKLIGPWVQECRQAWLALTSSPAPKKLSLDLRGVTFVDESGTDLLREIYCATRAEMIADSPLTRHFAEQVKREIARNGRKGVKNAGALRTGTK